MGRTAYAHIDRALGVRKLGFGRRAIFIRTDLKVGKGGRWPKLTAECRNPDL